MKRVKLLAPHFINGALQRGVVSVPDDFESALAIALAEDSEPAAAQETEDMAEKRDKGATGLPAAPEPPTADA